MTHEQMLGSGPIWVCALAHMAARACVRAASNAIGQP